jgi:hypothetical protein
VRKIGILTERVELVDGEVVLGHSLTVRVSGRHGCLRTAASLESKVALVCTRDVRRLLHGQNTREGDDVRLAQGAIGSRLASRSSSKSLRLAQLSPFPLDSTTPSSTFASPTLSCIATGSSFDRGPAAYSSAMLPCPSRAAVAALSLLTLIAPRPTSASASSAPPWSPDQVAADNATTSPNPEGYQPYLAYPHGPRRGHAFLPFSPDAPVHPLIADLSVPEEPTNPAYPPPQWANNRHPLYTPGQPPPRFTTEEFQFQPERLDKRAVVSSVDVPFPPSACTYHEHV